MVCAKFSNRSWITALSWIQHLDTSMSFTSDDASIDADHTMRMCENLANCGNEIGKTFRVVNEAAGRMRGVGFEDVQESWYKMPFGAWSEDPGCHILCPIHLN